MSARASSFRRLLLLLAGVLWVSAVSAQTQMQTQMQTQAEPSPEGRTPLRLDFREHRGYRSWKRLLPTHVKVQYAGGMGVVSAGYGWDYGRKCRWETDLMIGLLPGAYADKTHTTFTLRQNYIPWSIRCCERFAIEPFTCGLYMTLISGEKFWIHEPDRYPGDQYYSFTSRLRLHLYAGQRVTWYLKGDSLLRNITLYYELSANDLDIIAKCGNRTLHLSDIVYFSFGIKFQLLGDL
ncbi:hypothetical protein [uncultured Alistipes sp.]|uniref:hypothetical protein n=1 Tax=uncultured Alistipes sp. TaxID=538949 RepID=UPI0025D23D4F|nr:hypothetical protein [uncultured Alistipes sp.]